MQEGDLPSSHFSVCRSPFPPLPHGVNHTFSRQQRRRVLHNKQRLLINWSEDSLWLPKLPMRGSCSSTAWSGHTQNYRALEEETASSKVRSIWSKAAPVILITPVETHLSIRCSWWRSLLNSQCSLHSSSTRGSVNRRFMENVHNMLRSVEGDRWPIPSRHFLVHLAPGVCQGLPNFFDIVSLYK